MALLLLLLLQARSWLLTAPLSAAAVHHKQTLSLQSRTNTITHTWVRQQVIRCW
jgi:hypothetical protein